MKTALYRHFDTAGALLYVGISLSAVQRLAQHRHTAHWFDRIARIEIEWHDSREEALAAEIVAITREAPECNVQHAGGTFISEIVPAAMLGCDTFAIDHPASGRRDGNYFDRDEADDQLAWWCATFPGQKFHLVVACAGDPAWPTGATDGAIALRAFDFEQWRSS